MRSSEAKKGISSGCAFCEKLQDDTSESLGLMTDARWTVGWSEPVPYVTNIEYPNVSVFNKCRNVVSTSLLGCVVSTFPSCYIFLGEHDFYQIIISYSTERPLITHLIYCWTFDDLIFPLFYY